jgi:DNA-binding transcriptional ArsR family regulator
MKDIVNIFKAMGDGTRLQILLLLNSKNVCAKGISKHIGISEAAVSQHIKILKQSNIITGHKEGYYIIYNINKEVLQKSTQFMNLLIDEDIEKNNSIFGVQEFNILNCKNNCKSMKRCCKKKLEGEIK